jgi:hypothetical protein
MKPNQYKHIWVWGRMMSSDVQYIHDEQVRASEDNAPIDAIYKNQEGVWQRFADVTDPHTKHYFEMRKEQLVP